VYEAGEICGTDEVYDDKEPVYQAGELYEEPATPDADVYEPGEVYDGGEIFEIDQEDLPADQPAEDNLPSLPVSSIVGQSAADAKAEPTAPALHDTVGAGEEIPVLPASAIVNKQPGGNADDIADLPGFAVGKASQPPAPQAGGCGSRADSVFKGGTVFRQATIPAASATAATTAAPENAAPAGDLPRTLPGKGGSKKTKPGAGRSLTGKGKTASYLLPVLVGLSVVLTVAVCIGAYFAFPPETAEQRWVKVKEIYTEKRWKQAVQAFKAFGEDYPDSPHAEEVPFFLAMCEAGPHVFSVSGDLDIAWAALQQVFHDHRDNPAYNDYAVDLYLALIRVADRHIKYGAASTPPDKKKIATGAEALDLAKTVTLGIDLTMADWIPPRTAQTEALLASSQTEVKTRTTQQQVAGILTRLASDDPGPDIDKQYQQARQLLDAAPPEIANGKAMAALWQSAYEAEALRVQYIPDAPEHSAEPPPAPQQTPGRSFYPVWSDGRTGTPQPGAPQVVFSVARGVLYAFTAQGRALWQMRLGIDSYQPPALVDAGEGTGEVALVVATAQKALLALEPGTGRVLWRYQPHLQLTAPPLIVELPRAANGAGVQLALLPAGKEVHVLELSRGRRLGVYRTGQPMTVGGAASQAPYDPSQPESATHQLRQLAFFPADTRRVFALNLAAIVDPTAAACKSVLFTGHASGSLRSPPLVISSQSVSYFVLTEAADLDSTRLKAYRLGTPGGFIRPDSQAVTDVPFKGWSWFSPSLTADRIAVVSDEGDLGVYGVNLDNASEGVYPLVAGKDGAVPHLEINQPFRALAIHSDESFLWLLAGGRLRKIFLDVIHQNIKPLWEKHQNQAKISGAAAHRAQLDRWGRTFYLTTMSEHGGKYELSAVDADSGSVLWQRQLGMTPAGDPMVLPKGVLVFDRTGRTNGLPLSLLQKPRANIVRQQRLELPREASASRMLRLKSQDGQLFAIARLGEPVAATRDEDVAIRRYQPNGGSGDDWLPVHIPGGLTGRPGVYGDFLFACCGDGHMRRFNITDGTPAAATFKWTTTRHHPSEAADVFALAADDVIVIRSRSVERLKYLEDSSEWRQVGLPHEVTSPLTSQPALIDQRLLVFNRRGEGSLLQLSNLRNAERAWSLSGYLGAGSSTLVTRGPLLIDNRIILIMNQRQLVCLSPENEKPLWKSPVFRGAITGAPQRYGSMLLVSDESGSITAVDLQTGQHVASHSLGPGVAPAAAAAPFASGSIFAPLTDGSVVMLPPLQRPQKGTPDTKSANATNTPPDNTPPENTSPAAGATPAAGTPQTQKEPGVTAG